MAIAPPPSRPLPDDDAEALIREARRRQRRRWVAAAAVLGLAVGAGFSLWATRGGGGSAVRVLGHGPIRVVVGHVAAPTSPKRGIGDVGSAGGVTWAINGRGIWLTTNGGRTWRRSVPRDIAAAGIAVASPPDIQFVNKRDGWMSAPLAFDRRELSKGLHHWEVDWTSDGGRTWHVSTPPGCLRVCYEGGLSFLDARHGFLLAAVSGSVQTPNKLFRTDDGGRTWQLVSRPLVGGPITFVNEEEGFAGGPGQTVIGLYQGPPILTLYRTSDGGRTWSKYDPAGSGSFVEPPYGALGREVLVAENGPNRDGGLNLAPAAVYLSHDGGRHWSGRAVPFGPAVAVSFSAASPSVWAWSSQQDLFVTEHAGNGWREVVLRGLPRNARLRKIVFTSRRVGWGLFYGFGLHDNLFRTTDGGLHWTVTGPPLPRRSR